MIQIFDCVQGTEEWYKCRMGIPTTSSFQCLIANSAEKKGRASYMRQLAAEVITGELTEGYQNADMARGKAMEDEARRLYSFMNDVDPEIIGFIRNGDKGCSPDSLIGTNGMLEIKTQRADLLIETIFRDEFPNAHKAQTQGALWVAERDWIDLLIYWPKMPTFIKRAYRDVAYIAALARAVKEFNEELGEMVEKIRAMGGGMQERAAA